MRFPTRTIARAVFVWIAALGAMTEGRSHAQGSPPRLRTVVRVIGVEEEALLGRIRGQTNDLALEITPVADAALEPQLEQQANVAERYAAERHASVVIWFRELPERSALRVHVLVPATQRLMIRELAIVAGERSATLEQAALVVRAALREFAAGAPIGLPRADAVRDEEPRPPPEQPTPPTPPRPLPALTSGRRPGGATWRGASTVGWGATFDGRGVRQELGLRLAIERRAPVGVELALSARLALPSEVTDRFATLRYAHHTMALGAGLSWSPSRRLHACACATLGLAAIERQTVGTSPGVVPAPGRWLLSPTIGPELRLAYRPWAVGQGRTLGLVFSAGADVVPWAPRTDYAGVPSGARIAGERFWSVQPRASLAFELAGALP